LVRFELRIWKILIFKWFLLLKIQINSKKPGFGRKNQLRTWSNLKAYHSIRAWFPFILGCSKNWYIHCKIMFTCWVSLFCTGFTLGAMTQATLVVYLDSRTTSYHMTIQREWFISKVLHPSLLIYIGDNGEHQAIGTRIVQINLKIGESLTYMMF
jgi:hypothetical protein